MPSQNCCWKHKLFSESLFCTQNHWIMQVGADIRMSQLWSPASGRASRKLRWGGTRVYESPKGIWKSPKMESLKPLGLTYSTTSLTSMWHVDCDMCSLNLTCPSSNLTLLFIPVLSIPSCRHQTGVKCPKAAPSLNRTPSRKPDVNEKINGIHLVTFPGH